MRSPAISVYDIVLTNRFWSKVNKDGPVHPILGTKCWIWSAGRFNLGSEKGVGYGAIGIDECGGGGRSGRNYAAHRVSWEFENGPIPNGSWVLHACDNHPCIRPSHLFLGTPADNSRDMVEKGRSFRPVGNRNGTKTRGERHGNVKLSDASVEEAARLKADGWRSADLAIRYGVCRESIDYRLRKRIERLCESSP